MNLIKSKSRVTHARNTRTPNVVNTLRLRPKIGSKAQLNANTGFMTTFLSELQRLRNENAILREERSEIYQHASYFMAHS